MSDNSTWMTKRKTIHNLPINMIVLPGTHDSGAYKIKGYINHIPFISDIVKAWTITQKYRISEQLVAGIRVFDFRISIDDAGEFYVTHTLFCELLSVILKDIKEFLISNPGEIVIIQFKNDWANRKDMNENLNKQAVKEIYSIIGTLLYEYEDEFPTYKDMVNTDKRIISFYEDVNMENYTYLWNTSVLYDPWDNTDIVKEKLQMLRENFQKMNTKKLNFISLTLTPQRSTVVNDVMKRIFLPWFPHSGVKDLSERIQKYFPQIIEENKIYVYKLCCIKLDFPTTDLINKIINLN